MTYRSPPRGFTIVELLTAVTVIAISASIAVPLFRGTVERVRVRAALDRLVGQLYRTRMMAVEEGGAVELVLSKDLEGCTRALRVQRVSNMEPAVSTTNQLDLSGLCLRHSGDSIVAFNGRGMLLPPTRSFFIQRGVSADSVVISIAGRVRRSYRRRRRKEKLSPSGNIFRPVLCVHKSKLLQNNEIREGTEITTAAASGFAFLGDSPAPMQGLPVHFQASATGSRGSWAHLRTRTAAHSRQRSKLPRSESPGFSLIEILVAMVILSFGIMGLQAVAMSALRSVAMADRQARYAAHASDSLEAALYRLRTGSVPTQLCAELPPFSDQLSRRITLAGSLATVTVTVIPSRSHRPSPPRPLELSSTIFAPRVTDAAVSGSACA